MPFGIGNGIVYHIGSGRLEFAQTHIYHLGTIVYSITYGSSHILVIFVTIRYGTQYHQPCYTICHACITLVVATIASDNACYECAMIASVNGQRVVAIVYVVSIAHIVAHQQTLVGSILNAVYTRLHQLQIVRLRFLEISPRRILRRAHNIGNEHLRKTIPQCIVYFRHEHAFQRERVGIDMVAQHQ